MWCSTKESRTIVKCRLKVVFYFLKVKLFAKIWKDYNFLGPDNDISRMCRKLWYNNTNSFRAKQILKNIFIHIHTQTLFAIDFRWRFLFVFSHTKRCERRWNTIKNIVTFSFLVCLTYFVTNSVKNKISLNKHCYVCLHNL